MEIQRGKIKMKIVEEVKVREFVMHYCETCKKDITLEEWIEHFNKNHNIRSRGQLVL